MTSLKAPNMAMRASLIVIAIWMTLLDTGIVGQGFDITTDKCLVGYFGVNCTGECHCLNGPGVCDLLSGVCTDYQCDRGWRDAPLCQTECPNGYFGVNCRSECHCNPDVVCNKVNGLCSDFLCNIEWAGPGCQIRKAKLTTAPVVSNVTCDSLDVSWRPWSLPQDIGDPPVGSYTIQQSLNSTSNWTDVSTVNDPNDVETTMSMHFSNVDPYTFYQFRIRVNRVHFEKPQAGIPSDPSPMVRPLEQCIEPTTQPPPPPPTPTTTTTTPSTTTTEAPTTTLVMTTQAPTTTPLPKPPKQVLNFSVRIGETSGIVTLRWAPPLHQQAEVTSYNVTYQLIGMGDCNDTYREDAVWMEVPSTQRFLEINDLVPWSRYVVRLWANNVGGPGEPVEKHFYSKEILPTGSVRNLKYESVTSKSATFTWDNVLCAERGGSFRSYAVLLRSTVTGVEVASSSVNVRRATFSRLVPYTIYGLQVLYLNGVGFGPGSGEAVVRTLQGIPPAPVNVRISNITSTTMIVTWEPPSPTHGILRQYQIIYKPTVATSIESIMTWGVEIERQVELSSLTSFTKYQVQVAARTFTGDNQGWGNRSVAAMGVTLDGQPSPPRDVIRVRRNTTCITITWQPPSSPNGIITRYRVSYRVVAVQSISDVTPVDISQEVDGAMTEHESCGLVTAAQYRYQVAASSREGYGQATTLDVWTEVGIPDIPPRPTVLSTSLTTVRIHIQPVVLRGGPVSGYFIVVSDVSKADDFRRRRRRSLPDPRRTIPLPGYTAAYLEIDDLRRAKDFVVGDNITYGAYTNMPLTRNTTYNIYFIVTSSLDGVTKMSFSQIAQPVLTHIPTTPAPPTTTTTTPRPTSRSNSPTPATPTPAPTLIPPSSSVTKRPITTTTTHPLETNKPKTITIATTTTVEQATTSGGLVPGSDNFIILIVFVVIGFLIIVAVILIVVFCCCRKKEINKPDEKNSSWLNYYTNHYYGTTKEKKEKWSDIYDLNQPRHVTINDKNIYKPDDLKVSEIHHNKPKISFEHEYKHLPQGHKFQTTIAERPENAEKNRFDHILAYDHSRVVLSLPNRGKGYINANYIDGFDSRRNMYIAAQSPFNEVTIADFWLMVQQQDVSQIVFLANLEEDGIVKSEQYWPENAVQQYGSVTVRHERSEHYAHFSVRYLEVHATDGGGAVRRVTQFHFTAWPEHGVPKDSIPFLEFRMKVRRSAVPGRGPVLVHCGTGVSRTGVYVALDALLEQAQVENLVNVYRFCQRMRQGRTLMVRTLKQYTFLYDALFEALLTNHTALGEDMKVTYRLLSRSNPLTDKSHFREQFEILEEFVPELPAAQCRAALLNANAAKNRFPTILPPDASRAVLQTPGGLGRTDYINALYLDTYTFKDGFIVTQTPLDSTVIDFWKLVYDHDVTCIVMLNNSTFKEETCAQYWPSSIGTENWDPFFVRLEEVAHSEHVTMRRLKLSNAQRPSEPPREVRQLQFDAWNMYDKVPWTREALIQMLELVEEWQEATDSHDMPVLVHCMDGASQSGLFCAASIVCEKMRIDDEVDIFHTVKHLKRQRRHFVNSLEQYKFLFKLVWDYLNTRMDLRSTMEHGSAELYSDV